MATNKYSRRIYWNMNEKVAMELLIDTLKKAGMEEYEALALICQLFEEEAKTFVYWNDYFEDDDNYIKSSFPA